MSTDEPTQADDELIQFEDFAKLKLRSGFVQSAEKHPNADRLLVLQIDVGESAPRTIVAGLATKYAPEDLIGRTVIVVVNLKPATLRGIKSEGMLLAAGEKAVEGLATLTAAVPPGTVVR